MHKPLNHEQAKFSVHNYSKTYPDKTRFFVYAKPYLKKLPNIENHKEIDPYWQIKPVKLIKTVEKYNLNKTNALDHPLNPKRDPVPDNPESVHRSLNRTRTKVADLIACNNFEWFGTFTSGHTWCQKPCPKTKESCKRYDDEFIRKKLTQTLNHEQRYHSLSYVLVPERHEDGALHFHGVLRYRGDMKNSGVLDKKGRQVYNATRLEKFGHNDFTRIESLQATANYCRKYITKTLAKEKGRRRYWHSKDLTTPLLTYNANPLDFLAKPHGDIVTHVEATPSNNYSIFDIHTEPSTNTGNVITK